jgi:2-methylaconitate cis-trans-isomerase PrpF
VDYTFVAIGVKRTEVDYSSNCGNMIAAIGPFAVDSGMIEVESEKSLVVRIHNTNTGKLIHSSFPVEDHEAQLSGELAVDGVAGTGEKIELASLNPA